MKWMKLSRAGKIIRNLLLILLLWVGIWLNAGAPYPTAEMELRRMERQNLIPASEVVFREESLDRQSAQMIEVGEDFVVSAAFIRTGSYSSDSIAVLPREEEPMLVWLRHTTQGESVSGEQRAGLTLTVIQTPEDAAWAELDVAAKNKTAGKPADIRLERTHREDGLFFFWFDPALKDAYGESIGTDWSRGVYVLRLYREDGSLIGEYAGYLDGGLYSGGIYLRR